MITLLLLTSIILICYGKKLKKKKVIAEEKEKIVISNFPIRLVNEITNGKIPRFNYPYINYEIGEECYYVDNAKYFTYTTTKYYQKLSIGTSNKGKYGINRYTNSTTYPITTTTKNKYCGNLIITNRRIIFNCDACVVCIPLSCVITFKPYNNKIVINSKNKIDTIYVANGYVVYNLINNIFRERNKL